VEDESNDMKITILADSLGLPRDDVGKDDFFGVTYTYLLDQSLRQRFGAKAPFVIERGMRRRTIEYVLDDWNEEVELKKPDILIVHVGIVDCAPRVFLRREHSFVAGMRFHWLRERILRFAHDHRRRIIETRKRVYVPLPRFERLVEEVVQKAKRDQIRLLLFINIISPPDEVEARSPGFQRNVELYNQVLSKQTPHAHVQLLDLNKILQSEGGTAKLTVDGIHLNETGHRLLLRELERRLMPLVEAEVESIALQGAAI
jgi:lysophospholipase L1-like esterase